jgi:diacylglycerol O-acyltransferase
MGRQVLEVLPIPPIALHLRTGIAMVSYADSFFFGVTADYDTAQTSTSSPTASRTG